MPSGDAHGPFGREFALGGQDLAEQAPVHPFHHHVDAAAFVVGEDLHDAGMVEAWPISCSR